MTDTNKQPVPDQKVDTGRADRKQAWLDQATAGLKAQAEQPSAFAETLRSAGVQVTQHPKPEVSAAQPAPPHPAGAPSPESPAVSETPETPVADEGLDLLVAPDAAPAPPDPRVAWREERVAELMEDHGMPEALARGLVNGAKRKDLETWLGKRDGVGSLVPPRGQAVQPLQAPAGAPDAGATAAAPAEGRQAPAPNAAPPSNELEALRQQVAALQGVVMGERTAQAREAFARAAADLRGEFPAILRQDGTLDPEVARVGQQLRQLPAYQQATPADLLRAAAAARFSTATRRGPDPAGSPPRTPVSTSTQVPGPPADKRGRFDAIVAIRSKYGDPYANLGPEKERQVQAELDRMFHRRS